MDKIITSGQILVFEVSKWLSWHKYSHQAKLSRFGLAGLPIAAILDFQMSISQPFDELHGWNSEFKLTTPKSITGAYFDPVVAILDFVKRLYISCLKSYKAENRVKLIIPKSITGTYFDTKLSRFGLAGLPVAAILDIQMSISQLFEEL